MSSHLGDDFRNDLLAAKERDLKPLREESGDALELDFEQGEEMEDFLDAAWCAGLRSGKAQMEARTKERNPNIAAVAIEHFEVDFKELMEESADALNLTLANTIVMWSFLNQAWMAGNRTCEAEMMAFFMEATNNVAEEAQKWLENEGKDDPR